MTGIGESGQNWRIARFSNSKFNLVIFGMVPKSPFGFKSFKMSVKISSGWRSRLDKSNPALSQTAPGRMTGIGESGNSPIPGLT